MILNGEASPLRPPISYSQLDIRITREEDLTVVKVRAGACGFITLIRAKKENKSEVLIEIESDCEFVDDLGFILQEIGAFGIKDFISVSQKKNVIFELASEKLPHSACPVAVAIIKASEVELGLNVPSPVSIEFESTGEDEKLIWKNAVS